MYCWAALSSVLIAAELLPLLLYCGLVIVVLLPLPLLHRASRQFFATTCQRVLLPMQVRLHAGCCMDGMLNCADCRLTQCSASMLIDGTQCLITSHN